MLFSEEWLRSYINPAMSSEELCEALTMAGLEVESVESIAPAFSGVVVAQVLSVAKHPNADKLHVCMVNVGSGEPIQIVCGAPNVAEGVKVPCAMDGAVLPGNFKIKRTKMRGENSNGMLCSARELGIGDDHSGLWILPTEAPIGEDIRKWARLDDKKIEIKLTPNRGDALSVIGVARDVHAITGAELTSPDFSKISANCDLTHEVKIEATDLCGRFSGRVLSGLNAQAATPQWMKERLERAGQRSISALVDISNYAMLEIGRPSHIFDLAKLSGPLTVRWGKKGEKAELLNGQTVEVDENIGVIVDGNGIEALGGIMGGNHAAVSLETTDVFIEAAFWWPTAIQGRCRRLNFSTDAAHRFERGVDAESTVDHLEYITRLIVDICGTENTKIGPVTDQVHCIPSRNPIKMRADRCCKIIGAQISTAKMAECFTRLGFQFEQNGNDFQVTPPSYRFDIEIEEDLVEEVARLVGYQNLPEVPPLARAAMLAQPEGLRGRHELRKELARSGYQELVNFSFVEKEWELNFAGNDDPIVVLNPIASQMGVMRSQLIGGLVDILKYNLNRKVERVRLFELGRIFKRDSSIKGSDRFVEGVFQPLHIAGLAYGTAYPLQWAEKARPVDFYDVKGTVESLIAPLRVRFEVAQHPALHPGRSASIIVGGERIGFIGELHPRLMQKYGLQHAPVVFELAVDPLLEIGIPVNKEISKFQPITRDVSVLIDAAKPVQLLFDAVKKASKMDSRLFCLTAFNLFDLYRPKDGDATAEKSLTFTAQLQLFDHALTDAEADAAMQAITEVLSEQGAHLRQ